MMQFSTHGTDEKTRSFMLDAKTGGLLMSLKEIAIWVKKFRKLNPRKVSLNFILMEQFDYDFRELRKYFDVEDVYLRLSPLNVSSSAENFNFRGLLREEDVLYKMPFSSKKLKEIIQTAEESGFSYSYAPAIDEEIKNKAACGQALETLKEDRKLVTFDEEFEEVEDLVKSYKDRDAKTLKTSWDPDPRDLKTS
jgi:hypothetical protein